MGSVMPGHWQLGCKISKAVSQGGESQAKHMDEPRKTGTKAKIRADSGSKQH